MTQFTCRKNFLKSVLNNAKRVYQKSSQFNAAIKFSRLRQTTFFTEIVSTLLKESPEDHDHKNK